VSVGSTINGLGFGLRRRLNVTVSDCSANNDLLDLLHYHVDDCTSSFATILYLLFDQSLSHHRNLILPAFIFLS